MRYGLLGIIDTPIGGQMQGRFRFLGKLPTMLDGRFLRQVIKEDIT